MDSSPDDVAKRNAEARRRVAILRRYAAIENPTAADDLKHAEELGQSVARLRQLVHAWKLHGDRALSPNGAMRDPELVARAVEAAKGSLDLTEVLPNRRAEVARRIDIVGRYLERGVRTAAATKAFADEYGVDVRMFHKAVTAWVLTPHPRAFPGAAVHRIKKERYRVVSEAMNDLVEQAIAEIGTGMDGTELHRIVAERCHAAGLKPAKQSFVYSKLMQARAAPGPVAGPDASLRLDRVAIHPIRGCDPLLLNILFGSPSGRILAHSVHDGPPKAAYDAALIAAYLRGAPSGDPPALLQLGLPAGEEWSRLDEMLQSGGVSVWHTSHRGLRSGRLAFPTFGDRIGRMVVSRINPRLLGILERGVSGSERAVEVVGEAVAMHNARRLGGRPPLVEQGGSEALADALMSAFASG